MTQASKARGPSFKDFKGAHSAQFAADTNPNPKVGEMSLKAIRDFYMQQTPQLAALCDDLAEPYKAQFLALKAGYDEVLAKLPATDMIPAAEQANGVLACLSSALFSLQGMVGMAGQQMSAFKARIGKDLLTAAEVTTQVASQLAGQVTADIAARVASGELVTKEKALQLCADASAMTETRLKGEFANTDKLRQEAEALKTKRVGLLAADGLPADNAAVLALPEEQFTAALGTAKKRVESFAKLGLTLASESVKKVVFAAEPEFNAAFALCGEMAARTGGGGPPLMAFGLARAGDNITAVKFAV